MRLWQIPPIVLCNKHLCGEHVECHMFVGTLNKGISVQGYLDKGLLEIHNLKYRHDILAEEMLRRGMKHFSPLPFFSPVVAGHIDIVYNLNDLMLRCVDCRQRIIHYQNKIPFSL